MLINFSVQMGTGVSNKVTLLAPKPTHNEMDQLKSKRAVTLMHAFIYQKEKPK
jgi:hypothetical protein